jgi:enoyl-CoA hydratase/carnithine racemase
MSSTLPAFEHFALALDDGIARVEFNRPARANALVMKMWQELGAAMRWVDATPAVRVAILGGRGRHFTAGIDLGFLAPFANRAGAAAGLFGFLTMLTALAVGAAFSLLHEASLAPIALIAAVVGLLAASSAWLPRDRAVG